MRNATLGRLQGAALGPELASDPVANAALQSLTHPAAVGTFFWSFERAGLDQADARTLISDLAVAAMRRIEGRHIGKGGTA